MASSNVVNFERFLECPICFDVMKVPIIQCEAGHSMCSICVVSIGSQCPICRGPMSKTRNFAFEQMIESLGKTGKPEIEITEPQWRNIMCKFQNRGCSIRTFSSDPNNPNKLADHESECKYREIGCEGANFCGWDCKWTGYLHEVGQHFKSRHKKFISNTDMDSENINDFELNLVEDETDIELVNYNGGQHYFWAKMKTSVAEQKIYFIIQLIGTSAVAKKFTFTVEIVNGPNKKLTVTQICENDGKDVNELFKEEKCAVFSFKTIKHFLKTRNNFKYIYSIDPAKKDCRRLK